MSSLTKALTKARPNKRPMYLLVIVGAALLGLWLARPGQGSDRPTQAVSASRASPVSRPVTATLPMPDHIIIVVEENHAYSQIIGSPSAPYINSLSSQGALFTNSHAITHPSQPNYLYLYSGSNQGTIADECPPAQAPFTSGNLGQYLISATLAFTGYSEDLPSPGSQVCRSGQYYRKHNPWVNFSNTPTTTNQPLTSYPIPANYDSLPTIGFVIPNQDHDMHDGTIAQADTWLQQNLNAYVQWTTAHNSLFILTFDEDNNGPTNQIATIFVGPMVVPGQYPEYINHLNVLRTLEDMYNLPHAGQSENYQPITDVWVGASTPTATATVTAMATPTLAANTSTPTSTSTPALTPTCVPQPEGWHSGPPLPTSVVRGAGVYFPPNGKFYVVGGRSSDAPGSELANPLEYDPAANAWITRSVEYPDNQLSSMACGVLTVSGTPSIYCVGGSAAGATTATARVFSYNPVANTITVLNADNWPGDANGTTLPGGSAVLDNKLYIVGGFDINNAMTRQTWVYDPNAASHWTQLVDYPVARGFIPVVAIGGMIYTAGGANYSNGTLLDTSDTFKYDPSVGDWFPLPNIPRATEETHALNWGGRMMIISGGRTPPNPTGEVDIYDPSSNSWSLGSPFDRWLRDFAADSDGRNMWLAGGYNGGTNFYIYSPGCTSSPTYTPSPPPPTPTTTYSPTPVGTVTTPVMATSTPTAPQPSSTSTSTAPRPTSTTCPISFTDVPQGSTFYDFVRCLACRGIINGYSDGRFRPNSNVTRGQLSKIVANAAGFNEGHMEQTFEDVPPGSTFYIYVERMFSRNIVGGYQCGGAGEPCIAPENRPYFRPNNNATRGQISKIDALAAGYGDPPGEQMFEDVAVGSTFYLYVQQLAQRSILGGYRCGGPSEPCVQPNNRPYFRPNNNATRGQTSKIVANTFFPDCQTPFKK